MISNIIRYREYIWQNAYSDLRNRYAGSSFGFLWLALNPLAQIIIYSLIFTTIMKIGLPVTNETPVSFTIYLCSGLLPWIGFAEIVSRSTNVLLMHSNDITMTSLPEEVLFTRYACTGYITMLLSMSLLLLISLLFGLKTNISWLFLPGILALLVIFACGLGMVLGVLNVFSRDVGQFVNIILPILMWTVPIVYVDSVLSENIRFYLSYNPLYPFVSSLHNIILFRSFPNIGTWVTMSVIAISPLILGYTLLRLLRNELRDVL